MTASSDINSIVKIKKIKQALPELGTRSPINTTRGGGELVVAETQGMVSPVTFTGLTYDDLQDVTITDDGGTAVLFKTLATAKLTDANGKEILIDNIIYEPPP